MMDKMGGWAKDAAPSNCLTVCGISREDACLDACARVICVGPSPVPSWNEKCLSRCSEQCMKGRSAQKG